MIATHGLEHLTTAILLLYADQRIAYANPAAEHLLAQSSRHLQGLPLPALIEPNERLHSALQLTLQHRASYSEQELELRLGARSAHHGQRLLVNCTASALDIDPDDGDAPALLLELRPIEQQVKIARETRIAEQNQANRELVRNLAHEIKNPLGGIRGAAQLLEAELGHAPHLLEYTQVIIGEADRLQNLVNRLLTPHKLPRYARIDIHRLLERVLHLLRHEFGASHTLQSDYDVSLPEVECDAEQMTQVLLNIARNACQSSASAQRPQVVLRTRVARHVVLARRRHRMALEITIADNGPGIAPEHFERIFYPLFTTREDGQGSGLGLSIAQTFVAQHHGLIEVDSEPGDTRFRILLPFDHPADHEDHA